MDRGDRGSGFGPRAQSADLQIRLPRQQAEQFTACVTAGPWDRDSSAHVALASWGLAGCILAVPRRATGWPSFSAKLCSVAINYATSAGRAGLARDAVVQVGELAHPGGIDQ